jgi:hypothetical protein
MQQPHNTITAIIPRTERECRWKQITGKLISIVQSFNLPHSEVPTCRDDGHSHYTFSSIAPGFNLPHSGVPKCRDDGHFHFTFSSIALGFNLPHSGVPTCRDDGHSHLHFLTLPRVLTSHIQESRNVGTTDIFILHSLPLPRVLTYHM